MVNGASLGAFWPKQANIQPDPSVGRRGVERGAGKKNS